MALRRPTNARAAAAGGRGGTAVVVAGAAHAHTLNVVLVLPDLEVQLGTSPLNSSAWESRIEYENGMTHVIMFRSWLPMGRTISRYSAVQCYAASAIYCTGTWAPPTSLASRSVMIPRQFGDRRHAATIVLKLCAPNPRSHKYATKSAPTSNDEKWLASSLARVIGGVALITPPSL